MREISFHNGDEILRTGETSDKLYFVSQGKVGVYIVENSDYTTSNISKVYEIKKKSVIS